ncbi:MAG: type II secretion system protein [Gammaproteobacteria bacterium]|nr:type II secretion system protein [Gammaproteobacteria bacterium]
MKHKGFTLIELIVFIVVMALLAGSILIGYLTILKYVPKVGQQMAATQTAVSCMEWYLGQRYTKGFNFNGQSCPGGADTNVPAYCSNLLKSGYTLSTNINCTTIDSDPNYKLITVTVGGSADAKLSLLVADYTI